MINQRSKVECGFTLLEVLVVMVMVGVIAGFAVLAVGRNAPDRLAEEGQRLAALITLQQQEALLTGEVRGIQFNAHGYAIYHFDPQEGWHILQAADNLVRRVIPTDLEMQVWVENRRVALEKVQIPQVLLLNNGEVSPFSVVFRQADEQVNTLLYRVTGDALGRLTLGAVDSAYN